MRIVHVVRQFPPAIGGIEDFVLQLASRQAAAGHRVRVVTLNRIFDDPERRILPPTDSIRGIEVVRIPFRGSKRYPVAPSVLRHIRDADVVHVHAVDFFFDFLSITRPLHRRPLVVSTHGGFFHTDQQAGLKKLYFNTVTRALIRGYRSVIPSSLSDEATFGKIRKDGIVAIENGVALDKFAGLAKRDAKTIIYFGRLAPNKGIDRLLGWFGALHRVDADWRLIVAGKPMGVEPGQIEAAAARLGISARVEVHPTPSDAELAGLVSRSGVYACASDYEGFGLAAVEAIAAGLFPVLSDIPAFRRTVERVGFGLLSDFGTSPEAARVFLLAWSQAAREDIGAVTSRLPALFGWDGVSQAFEAAYRAAITAAKP